MSINKLKVYLHIPLIHMPEVADECKKTSV